MTIQTRTRLMAGGVVVSLVVATNLLAASAASAAPGDASAQGVSIDLDFGVLGIDAVTLADIGASSVAGAGVDEDTVLGGVVVAEPAAGLTVDTGLIETYAESVPDGTFATAQVDGATVSLLGLTALDADLIAASAVCPVDGEPTSSATVTGLTLLGEAVTLDADQLTATADAELTGDLLGVLLTVEARQILDTTAASAAATAIQADFSVSGTLGGQPIITTSLGSVTLASAQCQTPSIAGTPVVTEITPTEGPTGGGTEVTITGTDLAGTTAVTFDGAVAEIVGTPTATTVTVRTPAGVAGPADVIVTTPAGTDTLTGGFTYIAPPVAGTPVVTEITPTEGPTGGGTEVTITGTDLAGTTAVTFDGAVAEIVGTPTATTVTVRTPAGVAGPADVVVTTPAGTDTLTGGFTYIAPDVTAVTPDQGPVAGGTTVVIEGTDLDGVTGVLIGGQPAVIVSSTPTSITVRTPAGSVGAADIVLEFPEGTLTLYDGFTYLDGFFDTPNDVIVTAVDLGTTGTTPSGIGTRTGASSTGQSLAYTGTDSATPALSAGILLLLLGAGSVLADRYRRRLS